MTKARKKSIKSNRNIGTNYGKAGYLFQVFGLKYLNSLMRILEGKKFGSGKNIPDPQHWTPVMVFFKNYLGSFLVLNLG
jgi:hypothetical protein